MPELYLKLLDRVLTPSLVLLALFLLLRGHNSPGGGFIAGLVLAAAVQLQILSRGEAYQRRRLGPFLQPITGLGLVIALGSAALGLVSGTFFQGVWRDISVGPLKLSLGSPQFFDVGVFFVVFAVVSSFLLGLSRGNEQVDIESAQQLDTQ